MAVLLDRPRVVSHQWADTEWDALVAALARRQLLSSGLTLGLLAVLPSCGRDIPKPSGTTSGQWEFTDDRGVPISLPKRPERIVAQTTASEALWDYGVRPIAIFGPRRRPDGSVDFQAGNIDLDAVESLGDYGEMDLEKLIALKPELYVDLAMYGNQLWYLGKNEDRVKAIAPTVGISMQRVSILESISRFETLSGLLGADLMAPDVVEAKSAFAQAESDLKAAIAEKPGLKILVVSPTPDQVYVASPGWMTDLRYFHDLGLDIQTHNTSDFFEVLSWEQVNRYPADLMLIDQRDSASTVELLAGIGT
jgi:iron complex transport system substrate-binding protein